MSISIQKLALILEAALLAADVPLAEKDFKRLFTEDDIPDKASMRAALESIEADCESRSYYLKEVASGWRFQIRQDVSEYVSRLWEEKPQRYTRALLETLALVAYRQPITRGDIEDVRGVAVSSQIMRTLQERDWVQIVGHRDVPGRPAMYATTKNFLDYFDLLSLDQLPSLSEIKSLDEIAKAADDELAAAFAKAGLTSEDVLEEKRQQTQLADLEDAAGHLESDEDASDDLKADEEEGIKASIDFDASTAGDEDVSLDVDENITN